MLSKLFVYGTLNTPSNKFSKILKESSISLGEGEIEGRLYDIGNYPGVIEDSSGHLVKGEIYRLKNLKVLKDLDNYEDFDSKNPTNSLFIRKALIVIDKKGKTHRAWVYLYNKSMDAKKIIKHGDYKKYKNKKRKLALSA